MSGGLRALEYEWEYECYLSTIQIEASDIVDHILHCPHCKSKVQHIGKLTTGLRKNRGLSH